MNYRELREKIDLLKDEELDTEVTLYDDNVGRYYPVSKLTVNNIDPDFPPLIYMTIYQDKLSQIQT